MNVRVQLFAACRDVFRGGEMWMELPSGADVTSLLDALEAREPGFARFSGAVHVAVNDELVERRHALSDGDRVAVLPPVSGG